MPPSCGMSGQEPGYCPAFKSLRPHLASWPPPRHRPISVRSGLGSITRSMRGGTDHDTRTRIPATHRHETRSAMTTFRRVHGWPAHYRVGDDGSLWSSRRGGTWQRLKTPPANGHPRAVLTDRAGKTRYLSLAKLVCRAFHGPRPIGCEVLHYPDPDPANCQAANLRWVPIGTSKVGNDPLPGRHPDQQGERNPNRRLNAELVIWARRVCRWPQNPRPGRRAGGVGDGDPPGRAWPDLGTHSGSREASPQTDQGRRCQHVQADGTGSPGDPPQACRRPLATIPGPRV